MTSATQLSRPPCHLCGKELNRFYIDLRYTGVGRHAVCIPCANGRYAGKDPKWIDPDAPGQRATNIQLSPVVFLPSADHVAGGGFSR